MYFMTPAVQPNSINNNYNSGTKEHECMPDRTGIADNAVIMNCVSGYLCFLNLLELNVVSVLNCLQKSHTVHFGIYCHWLLQFLVTVCSNVFK